jgi:iron complex transport system substrate-binding protein
VAVVDWVDPPFTAHHWIPDMVAPRAGGRAAGQVRVRPDEISASPRAAASGSSSSRHVATPAWCDRAGPVGRPGAPGDRLEAIDADGIVVAQDA